MSDAMPQGGHGDADDGNDWEEVRKCSSCLVDKPRDAFSKKAWKNGRGRKCTLCVASTRRHKICAVCRENKPIREFDVLTSAPPSSRMRTAPSAPSPAP